jgi:3D-(3,5/4)-trihydroxycyclohexane-1,2-dione acylhydrolase (decyclizing)
VLFAEWEALLDGYKKPSGTGTPTYAHVVEVVNRGAKDNDTLITAAGGLPGEVTKGWRVKKPNTFDCEFGFSCMGYEIAAGWGHAMAKGGDGTPIVMLGDGTYMMMNSDIFSTVLSGHKMIVIVCDNLGYAVISRLQTFKGVPGFNNLLKDCRVKEPFQVDFVKHAEAMGALARRCDNLAELEENLKWAQGTDRTTVLTIATDAFAWVPGDADWDVGVPEVSDRKSVQEARESQLAIRRKQRRGV